MDNKHFHGVLWCTSDWRKIMNNIKVISQTDSSDTENNKNSKGSDWFQKSTDKDCALRVLLFSLLKDCLGMNSGYSYISWNKWSKDITEKPFRNKFDINRKSQRVFTNSVLADFIFLCVKRGEKGNIEEYLDKAIDIIKNSKYSSGLAKCNSNMRLFCDSEKITYCHEQLKKNTIISDEKCRKCKVTWIINSLQYIENNYESIMNHKNVLYEYSEKEQAKLVDDIYKDIIKFNNKEVQEQCETGILFSIFNSCIRSYYIPDVEDYKLAYIKWFTAHLSNWPFFKACLLQVNHYDESGIYQMLSSASAILRATDSTDENLLSYVESELLISYLTMGYTSPFSLLYCNKPQDIIDNSLKVLKKVNTSEYRLKILVALWNFRHHFGIYESGHDSEEQEIISICRHKRSNSIKLLNAQFQLYRYYYDPEYINDALEKFQSFINCKGLSSSETFTTVLDLFIEYERYSPSPNIKPGNPYHLQFELKGSDVYSANTAPCARSFRTILTEDENHLHGNRTAA